MKTIHISLVHLAGAFARPARVLAVSAVLGALVFTLPAKAAGHGGPGHHGAPMPYAQMHAHAHGEGSRAHHGMHPGRHAQGGDRGQFLSERALDRVQATPEQKSRIRDIMTAARRDVQAQQADGRSLRDERMQLFSQPEIDAKAVENLRAQAMARRDAASKRMTQAMVEAGQVLTPVQRQQLAQHSDQRREMMRRHREERRALEAPRS
jgi:protein CpxP